jgi:hypothetical protein
MEIALLPPTVATAVAHGAYRAMVPPPKDFSAQDSSVTMSDGTMRATPPFVAAAPRGSAEFSAPAGVTAANAPAPLANDVQVPATPAPARFVAPLMVHGITAAPASSQAALAAPPARASVQETVFGAVSVAITARPRQQGDQLTLHLPARVRALTLAYVHPLNQQKQVIPLSGTPLDLVVDVPALANGAVMTLTLHGESRDDRLCLVIPAAAARPALPVTRSASENAVATLLSRLAAESGDYLLCPAACLTSPDLVLAPPVPQPRSVQQFADRLGCRVESNGRLLNLVQNNTQPAGKLPAPVK